MGEVYKAKDTRLDRTVAIKILPSHGAGKPDARQRFEREAKAVSSLNHPHICALYDVGRENGIDYLVMEYLEGETLQARLARGPLPVGEVLRYGVQIAEALAQAHRQGVSHRDLKPSNIVLTKKGAKLLDFGLAKLREPVTGADGTTLTSRPTELTQKGTILGTFQYMSPEQLEGKEADARSDIFAFGAVLYEMATGRKAFEGKSQASLIAAIMSSEPPPISSLESMSPPALDRVVKKCLEKDPEDRWQSAQDMASELKWISGAEGSPSSIMTASGALRGKSTKRVSTRERIAWGAAALLLVGVIALGSMHWGETPPERLMTRFSVPAPEKVIFRVPDFPEVSPDGRWIAFAGLVGAKSQLWIRPLDSLAARALPGTEGALFPFWSPDSRSIGFMAGGKLKRIELAGGAPETIADVPTTGPAAWSRGGVILFSGQATVLYKVAATGGEVKPATGLDSATQESGHGFPYFLPDGRHFLYVTSSGGQQRTLYAGSLDSTDRKRIIPVERNARYVESPSGGGGYLLLVRGSALIAQPFDAKKQELSGDAFSLAERLAILDTFAGAPFSASSNGVLAYRTGENSPDSQLT
jgi:serine/threonine protein kinase